MDRDQTIREERDLCICFFIDREFLLEAKRDRSKLLHAEESGARGGIFREVLKWRITSLPCASC